MVTSRHHFRPRSHLAHFADESGKVWTYQRGKDRPFTTNPINVGVQGHLYTTDATATQEPHVIVEDWLGEVVDSPTAPVLVKISVGNIDLTAEEVAQLAIYLAAQDMRTPAVLDLLTENSRLKAEVRGKSLVLETLEEYEAEHGQLPAELRDTALQIPEPSTKNAWLRMMMKRVVNVAALMYENSRFAIFKAPPGVPWISNDRGIVKFASDTLTPMPFVIGLAQSKHWMMTVSPAFALWIGPQKDQRRLRITPFMARSINSQMVRDAVGQVYCHAPAAWIERLMG